jgi:PhnB protein
MPDDVTTQSRPSAEVMRGVIPYLDLNGRAGEAADFYIRAFAAKDLGRMEDAENPGRHMHIQLEINGGALMLTDGMSSDPRPGPQGMHLQLVVDDGQAWWDRAIAAGCTVAMPYERQFWGDDWGLMHDPFGVAWAVLQPGPEG